MIRFEKLEGGDVYIQPSSVVSVEQIDWTLKEERVSCVSLVTGAGTAYRIKGTVYGALDKLMISEAAS